MQQLILDPSLEAVRALADFCHLDRMPLATSLLRIFRSYLRLESIIQQSLKGFFNYHHFFSLIPLPNQIKFPLNELHFRVN